MRWISTARYGKEALSSPVINRMHTAHYTLLIDPYDTVVSFYEPRSVLPPCYHGRPQAITHPFFFSARRPPTGSSVRTGAGLPFVNATRAVSSMAWMIPRFSFAEHSVSALRGFTIPKEETDGASDSVERLSGLRGDSAYRDNDSLVSV